MSLEVERQLDRQRDPLGRHVEVARQRVADDLRLLVDFLRHEVAVVRLVDQEATTRRTSARRGCTMSPLASWTSAPLRVSTTQSPSSR